MKSIIICKTLNYFYFNNDDKKWIEYAVEVYNYQYNYKKITSIFIFCVALAVANEITAWNVASLTLVAIVIAHHSFG